MAKLRLVFDLTDPTQALIDYLQPVTVKSKKTLANYIVGIEDGAWQMNNQELGSIGAVSATGTFTVAAGNLSNNDTVTIGGVAFTAKTSGATGNQFNIGGTALATAQACATAVNASSSCLGLVSAAATGTTTGIVTFTSIVPGIIGNQITLAKSAANGTVSGANLASGAEGTVYNMSV